MGRVLYYLVYFALFLTGFELLKVANVMEMQTGPKCELSAKFIVMIIVLVAITRGGLRLFVRLTGYKHK